MKKTSIFLLSLLSTLAFACSDDNQNSLNSTRVSVQLSEAIESSWAHSLFLFEGENLKKTSSDPLTAFAVEAGKTYTLKALVRESDDNLSLPQPLTGLNDEVTLKATDGDVPEILFGASEPSLINQTKSIPLTLKRLVSKIEFEISVNPSLVSAISIEMEGLNDKLSLDGKTSSSSPAGYSRTLALTKNSADKFVGAATLFPKEEQTMKLIYHITFTDGETAQKERVISSNSGKKILNGGEITLVKTEMNSNMTLLSTTVTYTPWEKGNDANGDTSVNPYANLYQVDALVKVTEDKQTFTDNNEILCVARGETATLQVVVSANQTLTNIKASVIPPATEQGNALYMNSIAWVHQVLSTYQGRQSSDHIVSSNNFYPDPLVDDAVENIEAGKHRAVWVSIPIPEEAVKGIYNGTFELTAEANGKEIYLTKPFSVQVYPVNVGEPKLYTTNWIGFGNFAQLNKGVKVEDNSPLYWQLFETLAKTCKEMGQNTYKLPAPRWPFGTNDDGSLKLAYDIFDRQVETLIKHGGLKRIELDVLLSAVGGWGKPFRLDNSYDYNNGLDAGPVKIPIYKPGTAEAAELTPAYEKRVRAYFKNYFTTFYNHMKEKGWADMVIQHLGDEPTTSNVKDYLYFAKLLREETQSFWPDLKIIDAIDRGSTQQVATACDVMVPRLDVMAEEHNFFKQRVDAGKETWMYTAMFPQNNYANRFVAQPALMTRLLPWINYRTGTVGFLHWGLMWWKADNLWQDISQDCSRPGDYWSGMPGGDPYILYPAYHRFYSSIRACAQRDGIYDYNLLKMIEAINPYVAKAFVDELIKAYDRYNLDIPHFRLTRKEMLEFLSGDLQ